MVEGREKQIYDLSREFSFSPGFHTPKRNSTTLIQIGQKLLPYTLGLWRRERCGQTAEVGGGKQRAVGGCEHGRARLVLG